MKTANMKMLVSLVGIGLAVPFFAIALVVGAHAISLAQSSTDNVFLLCVACCAAVISVINGLGRNTSAVAKSSYHRSTLDAGGRGRKTASIHLGF